MLVARKRTRFAFVFPKRTRIYEQKSYPEYERGWFSPYNLATAYQDLDDGIISCDDGGIDWASEDEPVLYEDQPHGMQMYLFHLPWHAR